MAGEKNAGSIVYEISADVEPLLQGGKQAIDALDKLDTAAQQSGKGMDNLDQSTSQTGAAFTELAGYANSMDNQLKKVNTNLSTISRAMAEARSGTGGANSEFNRAESIVEALGNQLAVLDEAQENGARSAAVLAAQLRAGSKATDEEKQKIGELTGRLYDMKTGVETGAKGTGKWKTSMQQAGYQVQDFIVQVQGGQSALVAFSQQGSQLAGAFGPGGAVIGAIIALSTVVAGTLVASLGNGKNAIDALNDAIETTDKVISISQNGVGALSEKYAALARVNIQVATLMRNQAEIELQSALAKVSTEVQKASKDFIGFGDSLVSSLGGGYASVKLFNDYLSTLSITTNDFSEAMKQAAASGRAGQTTMQSMIATVGALAGKFDLTDQQAYEFAKQLSDIAKNPSDEKLNALIVTLQKVGDGQSSGAKTAREYAARLLEIATTSADASVRLKALKEMTDSLTSSQDKALKQARQELFITRQTGDEKMKAQAWRDAENQGIKEGTQAFRDYYNVRLQTYQQQEANTQASKAGAKATREAASAAKSSANAEESITKKLQNLRAASDLTTESIEKRRIEEAGLRAQQSLGSSATQQQMAEAKALGEANEKAAISIQKRKEAEQGQKFAKQEIASTQAKIDPATGQAIDPLAQVNLQEQQKLEALAKYQELDKQNTALYEQAKTAIQADAAMQRKQISDDENERQRQNMDALLGATSDFFGQMAGAVGDYAGESSAAYKALFAVSKGFAIAQASMNLITAISNAAALPWPANIPAIAFAAAQGASLISQIRGANYGGGREHGGTVGASSFYEVGEKNKPELLQMNGKNFMIPGNKGRVISNKDLSIGIPKASNGSNFLKSNDGSRDSSSGNQSAGVVIYNNVQNYTSSTVDTRATANPDGSVTIDTIVADINQGGRVSQAIQQNHQAPRKARE
ncbi:phage tail length tape measure family protein [Citrobacter portucalensis]|uniref:phage tail length tape measure family protein n=1 Tax=Citrobacter portucalensis TaxID=1639133 RepID=UPI0018E37486|nr:phage tail length tape measure family protein [Citrobacter portucalensis]MBI1681450.1 tail protein (tape measure) [Citrobacter portucalensis]